MSKVRGRPPKSAVPTSPQVLVSVEMMKAALREVAMTTVDEMTVERFVEAAAVELDAVFAGERPKAEIVRKLLPTLTSAGGHGQEAVIMAILDAFEARQAAKNAPPVFLSPATSGNGRSARRAAKAESSAESDTSDEQVASMPQALSVVDDDGYESWLWREVGAASDESRVSPEE